MSDRKHFLATEALRAAAHHHERQMSALRAAMDIGNPLKQIQDAMRLMSVPDYGAELRKTIAAVAEFKDPFSQVRDAMRMQDSFALKQLQETISAIRLPAEYVALQKSLESIRIADPLKDLQAALAAARINDPAREMQAALARWRLEDPTNAVQRAFRDLRVEGFRKSIGPEAWPEAHSTDAVGDAPETVNQSELQELLEAVVEKALAHSDSRLERFIATLVDEIRSLRNPLHEKLLTWVVFPILVALLFAVVNPVADYYVKEALAENERKAKKEIRAQVQATLPPSPTIDSFRFVSRKSLSVHQNPRAKSPIVGTLTLGKAVLLVEKQKDWSLVAWSSEDGKVNVQGWVYSRYLAKFR
jgi:hypothetical protein